MLNDAFYSALARSILSGAPTVNAITARLRRTLGEDWRWIRSLAERYARASAAQSKPTRRSVIAFLRLDDGLRSAEHRYSERLRIARWLSEPPRMQPVPAAQHWPVPRIESEGELAAWLGVSDGELAWFADLKRWNAKAQTCPVAHYHYRILTKKSGSIRLIEAPKTKLKQLQRVILRELVEVIPVHLSAHGFVKGRSIKTFAGPHVGRHVVLRMDLRDFFPSISAARVRALFRTAGYPDRVAELLGGLCTNVAPRQIWNALGNASDPQAMVEARLLYTQPHLPQGAPSSPALANLCMYRADCRLSGLARAVNATYTRYADDLAFSGDKDFERCVERFATQAAAVLTEEGFTVHHRKTRVMRQGVRQHLAGLVTNERLNVVRSDFDQLKAILTNCVRHGPASQNRDGHPAFREHLHGRVGFVELVNEAKGAKLRRILERIEW